MRLIAEEQRDGEPISVRPTEWLVQAIHQRGEFGRVRRLAGITRTPTIRPDGTVLQKPGYDEQTGLLYLPDCDFPPIPETPTQVEAKQAVAELLDVVADFPFASEEHRSIWLASVLTMLVRPAINGPCPLFVFDANVRGAGKSMLADVAGIIAIGSPMARTTFSSSEPEVRKTITAVAIEGWPAMLLDNVATTLGGPSLDAALTATTWQDRVLGQSKTTGLLPLTTVWLATGNNVELSADTARRTMLARLESLDENPEDNDNFKHPNLKSWATLQRPRLAVAGLTVVRAFFAADRPDNGLTPWGSFEAWSNLIRGAIVFSGNADPWLSREANRETDRSAELVRLLHAGIEEADVNSDGLSAADIVRLLSHPVGQDSCDNLSVLRTAITDLCGPKIDSKAIGYGLRKFRGRVCAGKRLASSKGHGGVNRWRIEQVESPRTTNGGDGGHGGDAQHPSSGAVSERESASGDLIYEF